MRFGHVIAPLRLVHTYWGRMFSDLPSGFNAQLYLDLNPDVKNAGAEPIRHYLRFGRHEGRPYSIAPLELQGQTNVKADRETILIVSHEASRTGAPVLSLNLVSALTKQYNVVALLLGGGALSEAFVDAGAATATSAAMRANPVLADLAVGQLCQQFSFKFAVVNSIESRIVLKPLGENFVPTVSLIHEFAAYTRPRGAIQHALAWSSEVVFSANVTRENAFAECPGMTTRAAHVLPQGRCFVPLARMGNKELEAERDQLRRKMRPPKLDKDTIVVLGAGFVQLRKGVDLFIECAARAIRQPGGERLRFVWIGKGFEPDNDISYSVYLADQIQRAGIQEQFVFMDETAAIDTAYEQADLFLLTSRLDPLPNVAIDAMAHGVPVLCFDKTTGIADFLHKSGLGEYCVADYIDTSCMAQKVLRMATTKALREEVATRCYEASAAYFSMDAYVKGIRALAEEAQKRSRQEESDTQLIANSGLFRQDFACTAMEQSDELRSAVRSYVRAWTSGIGRRKPCPGFHPGIYRELRGLSASNIDPFADYLRAGRPEGPWVYPVIENDELTQKQNSSGVPRVALHIHVYYVDLFAEISSRLKSNEVQPDLFISITDERVRERVVSELDGYRGRIVEIRLVPNRGRDIGPFLSAFAPRLVENYDVIGHLHTKKSADVKDSTMGKNWYRFLLDNLLGSKGCRMADTIVSRMCREPSLGLVFPDDPYVVGHDTNLPFVSELAARLGIERLPEHFLFPVGTMFWAKAAALAPLLSLNMGWEDYPEEPLPYDGTCLHAIERLIALGLPLTNLRFAVTNVAGVTR